jgi:mRNA-degrading endonuclease RelE of RelBE toxin-antitoxin system
MYEIDFTSSAREDLNALRKFEQVEVLEGIETQLRHEPTTETRNRKHMDTNELADWELRIGRFRVFYNVDEQMSVVTIEAIGFKLGDQLLIRGRTREL